MQHSFDHCNELNRKNLGDKFVPLELPEEDVSAFGIRDLVGAIVRLYCFPAEVVWRHTLPDLVLMLKAKEEREDDVKDTREQEAKKLVAALSARDRVALERLIRKHC